MNFKGFFFYLTKIKSNLMRGGFDLMVNKIFANINVLLLLNLFFKYYKFDPTIKNKALAMEMQTVSAKIVNKLIF
jgi:hypothetical protein